MAKYYYVRRDDGSLIDIPERHIAETLLRHPGWRVISDADPHSNLAIETPQPSIQSVPLECPLCGFVAKSEKGLTVHKNRKHA